MSTVGAVRVVLLGNPRSGRGLSKRLRSRFAHRLVGAGVDVAVLDVDVGRPNGIDRGALAGARALVVFGGDGTIHHVAQAAVDTGTPVYHVPAGNENLFAREFGMTRRVGTLRAALERGRVMRMDLGTWAAAGAAPRTYLIMASTGIDAGVVRRLHGLRTWALGHAAYAEPVLRETLSPTVPTVTVAVDGRVVVDARRGWLLVGNSRHYGLRLDFARSARVDDGLLDVVFLPHEGAAGAARWAALARLGRPLTRSGAVVARGASVRVASHSPTPWQLDGEYAGDASAVILGVQPGVLAVLTPPA